MTNFETIEQPSHGFWSTVGRQLRHPKGLGGRAVGTMMTLINRQPIEHSIETLNPMPGDTVLELGFGPGYGLERLASIPRIGKICGIDQSQTMFEAAKRRNRSAVARGDMQLVCGSARELPWEDDTFDHALLVNVIYFLDEAGRDLREIHRVLKPGGTVVAYATTSASMQSWPFCEPQTHRLYDADQLQTAFLLAGFARNLTTVDTIRMSFNISGHILRAHKNAEVSSRFEW